MRRLFSVLLLILGLSTRVAAYAGPGAWERVFFYHTYLMEVNLYGKAKSIAPKCPRIMNTGGRPCSYDEFITYLKSDKNPKVVSVTSTPHVQGQYPDVQATVDATFKKGETEAMEPARVVEGFKSLDSDNAYSQLLKKVGETFQRLSYDERISDTVRQQGLKALTGIISSREEASLQKFIQAETAAGRTVPVVDKLVDPKNPGAGTIKAIDPVAYKRENGLTPAQARAHWTASVDRNHQANVAALKSVLEDLKAGGLC